MFVLDLCVRVLEKFLWFCIAYLKWTGPYKLIFCCYLLLIFCFSADKWLNQDPHTGKKKNMFYDFATLVQYKMFFDEAMFWSD